MNWLTDIFQREVSASHASKVLRARQGVNRDRQRATTDALRREVEAGRTVHLGWRA